MTDRRRAALLSALLAAGVVALYLPVVEHAFLEYDDERYVSENAAMRSGLSRDAVAYAFTTFEMGNWHPITWLTHAFVVEAFGLDAGAHHLANVAVHAAVAVALLWTLFAATGSLGRSALVAALFAFHPQRVESVAWIAERKDVLVGLFFVLTIAAHVAWVRRPTAARYALVLAAGAAALMSKPMAVTLPAVLLLVDHWPLARRATWRARIVEKLPLLATCLVASGVAVAAQQAGGAVASVEAVPASTRIANAAVAYADYLRTAFWPSGLAVFYPYPPDGYGPARVALGALVTAGLIGAGLGQLRRRPAVGVGLLWLVGTLVPVIGLVTVGEQARADRYTYIPSMGLAIAVVWALPEPWLRRPALRAAAAGVVAALAAATWSLLPHWQDDEALFAHALAVTRNNRVAHLNYGNALPDDRPEEKRFHFERAIALGPGRALPYYNLGRTLVRSGEIELGIAQYQRSLALDPDQPRAWNNLGVALARLGEHDRAEAAYREALARAPDHPSALLNLAMSRLERGDVEQGRPLGERYLARRPADLASRAAFADALARHGDATGAIAALEAAPELDLAAALRLGSLHWRRGNERRAIEATEHALALAPDRPALANELAWMLATAGDDAVRDPARALALARRALTDPAAARDPDVLDTLAAAEAAMGDFPAARSTIAQATALAREAGASPDRIADFEERAARYRAGAPWRNEHRPSR